MNLEDRNYYMDSRVVAGDEQPLFKVVEEHGKSWKVQLDECIIEILIEDEKRPEDFDGVLDVEAHYEVCPTCEGHGKHVNPSIDSNGLTAEDFEEDPDFREEYMSGSYDVTCYQCGGKRVVPSVAFPEDVQEAIHSVYQARADFRREAAYGY